MKKKLTFATREIDPAPIINARNPYIWTECGSIVVPLDATDDHIEHAKLNANIPADALCIRAELL